MEEILKRKNEAFWCEYDKIKKFYFVRLIEFSKHPGKKLLLYTSTCFSNDFMLSVQWRRWFWR